MEHRIYKRCGDDFFFHIGGVRFAIKLNLLLLLQKIYSFLNLFEWRKVEVWDANGYELKKKSTKLVYIKDKAGNCVAVDLYKNFGFYCGPANCKK